MARFCHIIKGKISSKNSAKTAAWKIVPAPFVCKELSTASIKKWNFWSKLLIFWICNSKALQICPNQHADPLRFPSTWGSLKFKKGPELVSRPHFSHNFLRKNFILWYYINWPNFITRLCLLFKLISKMCFVFYALAFDDVMSFEYLKS